jgi:hypothetical protein
LIAPNKEDKPAKCNPKIAKSTAGPECPTIALRGDIKSIQYQHLPHKMQKSKVEKD